MSEEEKKKISYSGMQATGTLHLGNYLGALKNWIPMHEEHECFYGVMDLHSLTVRQDPSSFRKNAKSLFVQYVAAGLDPEKNCVYFQSHVDTHPYLSWILSCFTYMGELSRMTQYKAKSEQHADNVNAGLFTYPVLMAADILLYQATVVPVGNDQKQHVEMARDIAQRFNSIYGDVFTIPEPLFGKNARRVMSLADPEKKMSKSDENQNATVFLLDDKDTIIRKFKRAKTDSGSEVKYSPEKPGIMNLIDIYASVTGKTNEDIEKEFEGKGYGDFKLAVGEAVSDALSGVKKRYDDLMKNMDYIDRCIKENNEKARHVSGRTLAKVRRKVGLTDII